MLEICVLGSGSKGNSTYISDGESAFLIDAGFSGRELAIRLNVIGKTMQDLQAILITHDHGDHINGAGIVSRAASAPVHCDLSLKVKLKKRIGKQVRFNIIEPLLPFMVGDMTITAFDVPHDAIRNFGYIIEKDDLKIGFATDIGHPTDEIIRALKQCDLLVIESNHDEEMLATGPYPPILQERVGGDHGHVSNDQTAEILRAVAHEGLQRVVLVHLSAENNKEVHVLETAQEVLAKYDTELIISRQSEPTEMLRIG